MRSTLFYLAQIAILCAVTWALLDLTHMYLGRPAAWVVGLSILTLALFGLFYLRKKV